TELLVTGRNRVDRVSLQVSERHVDESLVAELLAEGHRTSHPLGPPRQLFGAEFLRTLAVAAPTTDIGDEAAHRPQHFRRIAMTPQEFGVRIRLDESLEREHMHGGAQMPQVRFTVPLQELEQIG